jgi:uncharacterized protein YbjT (DUF2867 family)
LGLRRVWLSAKRRENVSYPQRANFVSLSCDKDPDQAAVMILRHMRMLVTGASGFVGSTLIPRLLEDGHELRALAREPSRVTATSHLEIVRGDALTGVGLEPALSGIQVAYYLIHSMESPQRGLPATGSFAEREALAARTFAEAARHAGVERIVYLGGLLPAHQSTSRHLASREAVERILLELVPASVALRASIVIGAHSRSFRFLVRLVERMPVLALPRWRRFRTQPIDARDVTDMLARAAIAPAVAGHSLDIGGPQTLTYEHIVRRIADLMIVGRPAIRLGVNITPLAGRIAAAIAGEDPELIVPLMESLEGDLLADDPEGAANSLGVRLHSFDSAVERALGDWEHEELLSAR